MTLIANASKPSSPGRERRGSSVSFAATEHRFFGWLCTDTTGACSRSDHGLRIGDTNVSAALTSANPAAIALSVSPWIVSCELLSSSYKRGRFAKLGHAGLGFQRQQDGGWVGERDVGKSVEGLTVRIRQNDRVRNDQAGEVGTFPRDPCRRTNDQIEILGSIAREIAHAVVDSHRHFAGNDVCTKK